MKDYEKGVNFRFIFPEGFKAVSPTCIIKDYQGAIPLTTIK